MPKRSAPAAARAPARLHRMQAASPHLYAPTPERPLRAKHSVLAEDTHVDPHRHDWAQLAWSATGVLRLTTRGGTYLVPPSRALWIPPGVEHAVTVVERAALCTLYLHQRPGCCGPGARKPADGAGWQQCRVLEVSDLLRALMLALPSAPDSPGDGPAPAAEALERERLIAPLLADELRRAAPVPLGVAMPQDKRLRALCEAVLAAPTRHDTLGAWVRDVGASERTIARLFRDELGTSFGQWRQQVLLARALTLAARKRPMSEIAAELGYASPSAFSAMVRRSLGAPPSRLFGAA
ncbi:MAG TPA: helix-turn-helix transcriptional regulator [Methylibium sp.]|nr:helix-turn-helix transcriptional regulator [Methylibium sp.]